jgi:hypothetical protein
MLDEGPPRGALVAVLVAVLASKPVWSLLVPPGGALPIHHINAHSLQRQIWQSSLLPLVG